MVNLTAADRKWEAESDARTLADAELIKADSKKLTAAKKAAVSMAKEKEKEVKVLKKIKTVKKKSISVSRSKPKTRKKSKKK